MGPLFSIHCPVYKCFSTHLKKFALQDIFYNLSSPPTSWSISSCWSTGSHCCSRGSGCRSYSCLNYRRWCTGVSSTWWSSSNISCWCRTSCSLWKKVVFNIKNLVIKQNRNNFKLKITYVVRLLELQLLQKQ